MNEYSLKSFDRSRKIVIIALIAFSNMVISQVGPKPSSFGVWDRGEAMNIREYPFLKGTSCDFTWDEVEKTPGIYDWSILDNAVERAFKEKISLYISFAAGPKTPEWVYEKGVPKVITSATKKPGAFDHYPYYLSPEYKKYYHRFLTEVAKHISSFSKEKISAISFIQVKTGCTGDECAYKGEPIDKNYSLPVKSEKWREFRLETFALHDKLFGKQSGLNISMLLNNLEPESNNGKNNFVQEWDWAIKNLKDGFGIKNGALSRGHHLSGEIDAVNTFLPYLVDPKGVTLFRRSEMDQTWTRPWYQLNVQLNFYWGAINALNAGQSVWDVTSGALKASKEQGFDYSFYFFNKYAGQIHPETATDAFCALHKGLNAADTNTYPEDKFGKASHGNIDRMEKITAEYAKYGAANEDKNALKMGQVKQRGDQVGFNDAGWEIWPDNYSRLLYQIEPDETSIPLWRVGGPITTTSSIYSRFARGFEHATGKDALYFKLHEGFSQDNKPKVMSITVVWYDAIEGSKWKLDYDAGTKSMKTAMTVTGKGDKKWHHEVITIKDAVFKNGGTKGADFVLLNADDKDDIFSLVEVHRGEQELPLLRPQEENRAFKGSAKGTKYSKGENAVEGDKEKKGKREDKEDKREKGKEKKREKK
jgi:hypothetical protein